MVEIFQKILETGKTSNGKMLTGSDLTQWLRNQALSVRRVNTNSIIREAALERGSINSISTRTIGHLFLFEYDAKTKQKLPYWDRYPIVFPFGFDKDGFIGLNMHYLPPQLRARLMDAFYNITNNKKLDESTRLRLNYGLLKSSSQMKWFKPCVKKYLYSNMKTRLINIPANEWEIALFLPLQRFQKASTSKVWADSQRIINKR